MDLNQKNHTAPLYRIRIPDERAWFNDVITEDGGVKLITSVSHPMRLYCATHLRTIDGVEQTIVTEIAGPTSIRFPATPTEWSLHLFDERGREYDWLERRSYVSRVGVSLFDWYSELLSRSSSDLASARDRGEGDTIEFKPSIKPSRKGNSDKVAELLETVAAFANAGGGSIYIGVDDNGRVTGTNSELASYASSAKGDAVIQREHYTTYLKGIIAEGVQPTISVDMSWTDYSGLSVLRVAVPSGHERPYVIAENDAIYIWRGATNRAATRADVLDLGRQQRLPRLGWR